MSLKTVEPTTSIPRPSTRPPHFRPTKVEKVDPRDASGDLTERGDIRSRLPLHYVDPQRFGDAFADQTLAGGSCSTRSCQNVSVASAPMSTPKLCHENIIAFRGP